MYLNVGKKLIHDDNLAIKNAIRLIFHKSITAKSNKSFNDNFSQRKTYLLGGVQICNMSLICMHFQVQFV